MHVMVQPFTDEATMLPDAFRGNYSVLKKQAMGRERELGR